MTLTEMLGVKVESRLADILCAFRVHKYDPSSTKHPELQDAIADIKADIKAVFKEWLAEVGLPGYKSIGLKGNEFDVTEAIRKLLVLLVDEP